MEGSSLDQTAGQQKVTVVSTQSRCIADKDISSGKMLLSPQGKQDISSPIQKKTVGGIMLSKHQPLTGQIKSQVSMQTPYKVVVLPTCSAAAANSVGEDSRPQKVTIPSTSPKQPARLIRGATSPPKVLVMENKTSSMVEQIGSPASESSANVAQTSTILLIKPTTQTSKLRSLQERKGNTDTRTPTETNESKTKQDASGSGSGNHANISIKSTAHTSSNSHSVQKGESCVDDKTINKKETTGKTDEVKTKQDAPVSSDADDTDIAITNMVRR